MATNAKPKVSINTPKWGETTKSEFDAIGRRAAAFAAKTTDQLFDKDGNIVNPTWARIVADLDGWAKKHKVALSTTEHDRAKMPSAGGGPVAYSECPSRTSSTETIEFYGTGQKIKIRHTCVLRRQTLLGRCVYSCTSEQL